MKRTVISGAGTSAILIGAAILFTVKQGDFKGGSKPSLTVKDLAGTETATITKNGQPVRNGIIDRASEGSVTLESAGEFGFFKDATAAAKRQRLENCTTGRIVGIDNCHLEGTGQGRFACNVQLVVVV